MPHLTPELGVAILIAISIGLFVLRWPESGALLGIFALYLNIPVLVVKFHSVPIAVAAGGALVIGPALMRNILGRKRMVIDRPFLLIIVFLGAVLISTFIAPLKSRALVWIALLVGEGLGLYLVVLNLVPDAGTLRRMVWALVLAGGLLGSLTVYQEVTRSYGNEFGGLAQRSINAVGAKNNRAGGPIHGPNRYAQMLVVLLPLGVFCVKHSRSWYSKTAGWLCLGAISGGIVFTYSRGGFVGVATAALGMVALGCVRVRDLALGVGAVALTVVLVAPGYGQRMLTLRGTESLFSSSAPVEADETARARAAVMLAAWEVWRDHPLLGVGPGQFSPLYARDYLDREYSVGHEPRAAAAHCLYLQMGAELGIVGVGSFLAILCLVVVRLMKVRRAAAGMEIGSLAAAFVVALGSYLSAAVFLHLDFQRYYWLLVALGSATVGVGEAGLLAEREEGGGKTGREMVV